MSLAFLMAGGGTAGHVLPALAVARELRRRGHAPFFVGTKQGLEGRLVENEGFPMEWIEIGGLLGLGIARKLRTLWQLPASIIKCLRIMKRRQAVAVFSMGGYVAGPPMAAAVLKGVPMLVMEPNAVAGFTSRRMGRFAAKALISFPEAASYFPRGRSEVSGLPVREEFFQIPAREPGRLFRVLITGGSRGSRTLNQATRDAWPLLRKSGLAVHITLQCGSAMAEELQGNFASAGIPGRVTAFLDDMPAAFAEADLIVARAGAGSTSELAAAGKASLLVPYPFAADDHQLKNAEAMQRAGASRLILDRELTGVRLAAEIEGALHEPDRIRAMGLAARALAKPGAAVRAADLLMEFASGPKHS